MGTPEAPSSPPPGVPAWLQPVVQLTTQVGLPTLFALVLLWFVLFEFKGSVDRITQRLEKNADAILVFNKTQSDQLQELQKQTRVLEDLVRNQQQSIRPQALEVPFESPALDP